MFSRNVGTHRSFPDHEKLQVKGLPRLQNGVKNSNPWHRKQLAHSRPWKASKNSVLQHFLLTVLIPISCTSWALHKLQVGEVLWSRSQFQFIECGHEVWSKPRCE